MTEERLQKYLARSGVASRRHAEELITGGRVTVNNKVITELGTKVTEGTDLVAVDGALVTPPQETSYFIVYKPPGVVTTMSDPEGRPTVAEFIPKKVSARIYPVGRLDYDAEGALILTDDGDLANRLMHPSYQVSRTYLAKVKGAPDEATLDKLRGGVRLEDGPAKPLSVDVFESAEKNTWLRIVVGEGRPHLIKRLCAAIGHPVVRLFRPFHAGIGVDGLRPGDARALSADEVRKVKSISEGEQFPEPSLKLPARRHGKTGADAEDDEAPAWKAKWKARVEAGEKQGVQRDGGFAAPRRKPGDSGPKSYAAPERVTREVSAEGEAGAAPARTVRTPGAFGRGGKPETATREPRGTPDAGKGTRGGYAGRAKAGGATRPPRPRSPSVRKESAPPKRAFTAGDKRPPRAAGLAARPGRPVREGATGSRGGSPEGRSPRAGGFAPRAGAGAGRPPREGGFGSRGGAGAGRPPRAGRFSPRAESSEGRPPRAGGPGSRGGAGRAPRAGGDAPRGESFERRPPRAGGFGARTGAGAGRSAPRAGGFSARGGASESRAPRSGERGPPRAGGFKPRAGGFGARGAAAGARSGGAERGPPRAGGFAPRQGPGDDRAPRTGGFAGRGRPAGAGADRGRSERPSRAPGGRDAGAGRSESRGPPRSGGFKGKPGGKSFGRPSSGPGGGRGGARPPPRKRP